MIGTNSFTPALKTLLTSLSSHKFDSEISLAVVKGSVSSHTAEHKDSKLVISVNLQRSGRDTKLVINFNNDLTHGVYSYEFEVSSGTNGGFNVYLFGECGGTGYDATTLYRYWASDYLRPHGNSAGGQYNPVK